MKMVWLGKVTMHVCLPQWQIKGYLVCSGKVSYSSTSWKLLYIYYIPSHWLQVYTAIHSVRQPAPAPAQQYFPLTPLQPPAPAPASPTVFFSHTIPVPASSSSLPNAVIVYGACCKQIHASWFNTCSNLCHLIGRRLTSLHMWAAVAIQIRGPGLE